MYKNQLQELAQRSCFNLPSYTCFREGPDHAPRFKAAVNFNGETFESPSHCSTLRQAEHFAAEVALISLASRGPSNSLAARILDETGVYKNLLQEVSQRVGASLPAYTTFRTGQGHLPVFTGTVELAGVIFTGDPAKNKKQAEKNAAMAAWLSLKSLVQQCESSMPLKSNKDEQEHVTVARALQKYLIRARLAGLIFPLKFPTLNPKPSPQQFPIATSKILPLIYPKTAPRNRPLAPAGSTPVYQKIVETTQHQPITNETLSSVLDNLNLRSQKFPEAGAAPYIPVRHCNPHHRTAPPVTIRNTVPVFSAPPVPRSPAFGMAPPVHVRQTVPVLSASLFQVQQSVKAEDQRVPLFAPEPPVSRAAPVKLEELVFAKHNLARLEESFFVAPSSEVHVGQSELLASEISVVQVKSPVSKIISSSTSFQASAEETRIAAQLEGLKDLKK